MTAARRDRPRAAEGAAAWRRTLSQLTIGASVNRDGIAVARLSNNRFIVLKDGEVFDNHYNRSTVAFNIAMAVEVITGEEQIIPCADCGRPRLSNRSYCSACASRRVQESKHRAG